MEDFIQDSVISCKRTLKLAKNEQCIQLTNTMVIQYDSEVQIIDTLRHVNKIEMSFCNFKIIIV